MSMHPEWLKFRRSPAALGLAAGSLALPLLLWAFNQYGPEGTSAQANVGSWLLAPYALVALLAPYLLTLDDQLGTLKWIQTTPTRALSLVLGKWGVVLGLALLSVPLSAALGLMTGVTVQSAVAGLAGVLTSLLVITAVSLLTRSFPAVLIVGVVWMQLAPRLLTVLPEGARPGVWAALPGLGLSQYSEGPLAARLLGVSVTVLLIAALLRRRSPAW
ncbi:ABC-2 family transporter protein [Deinococcus reticulitermitis]|uniref:ABC-2 family transporter protein n=1 Tax=Deinococcus reticulitermitis TaxID=856736 RepID=A0A1H6T589_9DEIO|nr:ABC transporter permease [Deinococcus reticulitermitis]SEI70942.1 ABC-2 family transporter protein [Deinococcus reticulitermitis]